MSLERYSPDINDLSSCASEKINGFFETMKVQPEQCDTHSWGAGSWNNKEIIPAGSTVMYVYHEQCGEIVSATTNGIKAAQSSRVIIGTVEKDTEIRNVPDEMKRMIKGQCSGEVSAESLLIDEIYF